MSEDIDIEIEDGEPNDATPPAPLPKPTAGSFDIDDIERLTSDVSTVDVWNLQGVFIREFEAAMAHGDLVRASGLRCLASAVSIVLRPSDRGNPLGARRLTDRFRTSLPEDFEVGELDLIASFVPKLSHPGLRARLADIVWTRDRARGAYANIAIEAYCECAARLINGQAHPRFDKPQKASFEALANVERAMHLAHLTAKKREQPLRTRQALTEVYHAALEEGAHAVFLQASQLGLSYGLLGGATVASDAERLVAGADTRSYAIALRGVLDLAAQQYAKAGDPDGERRCQLSAVDQILRMKDEVSGPHAKAHWVQTALFAIRHVSDTDDRRRELRRELRDLQEDALGEVGHFSYPMDIADDYKTHLDAFNGMDLPEALRCLAIISSAPSEAGLRKQALATLERFPVSNMMATSYSDVDGKTSAIAPSADLTETPDDDWFKSTIERYEHIRRQEVLGARFEPARLSITSRFDVGERHFLPIVQASPFIRNEHAHLMSLGFARLLQGDNRSAVHLLVPQIEPCLRYVLRLQGHDPVIDFGDMTEQDVNLKALLTRFRPHLASVIPSDALFEVELIFHHETGSTLRHSVAHGAIGAGGCFSVEAVYGCWLLYHLTCWPLLKHWERVIRPAIEAEAT
ncbi:DUF7380 domain-containing protein [Phenylobacterium sp.]|uniref:DUF7380 domain-containing protein n=1 Tax=Phenylobacterium sp. TaxID=1871053 RepID=UPI003BA934A0